MHQHADHGKLRLLFGTNNQAKIEILKAFLENLPVELLSPADLDLHIYVREDGWSPGENAAKKARAYFTAAQIPTFAIDAALSIPGLPPKNNRAFMFAGSIRPTRRPLTGKCSITT